MVTSRSPDRPRPRPSSACDVELLDYPDGALAQVPAELLSAHVLKAAARANATLLLVFDECGITGHPDHRQATRAASLFAWRARLPVLAWAWNSEWRQG